MAKSTSYEVLHYITGIYNVKGRGSSVSIVTRLSAERLGFDFSCGQALLGPTNTRIQWIRGSFPTGKAAGGGGEVKLTTHFQCRG